MPTLYIVFRMVKNFYMQNLQILLSKIFFKYYAVNKYIIYINWYLKLM